MKAVDELLALKDEEQAVHLMRFFKTGKGQYGEGDEFLGIRVPKTREVAKKYYKTALFDDIQEMLNNKYHEIRLCALLMMVLIYEKIDDESLKDRVLKLDIHNVNNINNWDLVDLTAPKIIGAQYLKTRDDSIIRMLSNSKHLWSERIAVVAQWSIIRAGEYNLLIELCEKFLHHRHDLMHKAAGWMLREAGKKDKTVLTGFLDKYSKIMPRTMLRYSIEKLSSNEKRFYMKKEL